MNVSLNVFVFQNPPFSSNNDLHHMPISTFLLIVFCSGSIILLVMEVLTQLYHRK